MSVAVLLTFCSAFLFYLSFPNILIYQGIPFLTWLCLVPLFFALRGRTLFQRLELGVIFGFVSYGLLVQWLLPISIWGFLLFVFVLMTQPVLFCMLSFVNLRSTWLNAFYVAILWVGLEYVRTILLGGFVFGLGYSQSTWPVMIQSAEWAGVYGVSFLLVLANYLFFGTLFSRGAQRQYGIAAIILICVVAGYGIWRMAYIQYHSFGEKLTIGVAQANIDPEQKLDLEQYDHNIMEHMRLTKQAAMHQTDLVIWPETALVDDFFQDLKWRRLIRQMIQNLKTQLLIGSATLENNKDYNSAVLLDKKARIKYVYHKKFLVPFTEYIPKQAPFNLFYDVFNLTGFSFERGRELGLMSVNGSEGKPLLFGLAICSETGYPSLYRGLGLAGARFYVSMLNDGWFKQKAALMLHLQQDIFRSVENRLPTVRSANTGVSAYIDQRGVIERKNRLPLMTRAYGVFPLVTYLLAPTPYALFGDVFALCCLIFAILLVFVSVIVAVVRAAIQIVKPK